jgi:hypothetical protein
MAKYRFKTDVPEPSDEQIVRYKDFSRVKANYQAAKSMHKMPLYKNKKVFLALILIVILAFLISEFLDEKKRARDAHSPQEQTLPGQPQNK